MNRVRASGIDARCSIAGAGLLWLIWLLFACSPTLDWREVHPAGSGVTLLFPCRPDQLERVVRIGDAAVPMRLHACKAGEATFSLAAVDAGGAARAVALLPSLRAQAIGNVGGVASPVAMPAIVGATPDPAGGVFRIEGRLPDGRPVVEHAAFFVKGPWLYQATVLAPGPPLGPQALEDFFRAIRVR